MRSSKRARGILVHAVLLLGVLLSLFPFYWTVVLATNNTSDVYRDPPKLVFGSELFVNIRNMLSNIDFFGSMFNTLIVALCTTALVLFLDSLAAFTFAKYDFPGKRALFGLLLLTFMLPMQLALIPEFEIMVKLNWVGDLRALIIPAAANAFGIFWMRQYTAGAVPSELLEAARLDGCGFFRQYWHVCLPIIRPGLAFLGIYTFVGAWNDYIWPLIVLVNPNRITLQVALAQLNTAHGADYSMIMAGALLALVPVVLVFVVFARQFMAGAVKGALRG
ncbi:MAG TPA: carbohydrate ABC transporter permease [Actinospica sp.]|nr:carbohydrate ABC transporter permease [Actinospica sp.]